MTPTATERATTMKAIVRDRYGPPDVLELQEVERPELPNDGVLVRVRAAAVRAPRAGPALLGGFLVCGRCGRRSARRTG